MRDFTRGMGGRRRPLVARIFKNRWNQIVESRHGLINDQVMKYATSTAKTTGIPVKKVLRSKPAMNFRDKIWLDK